MTRLRVGWHREHFLSPLLQLAAEDDGKTFELVECPGGTGEMQVKLKAGEIDVCIDALIAGLANGLDSYKLVGRYISSPLRWAIVTGKDSKYLDVADLKGTTFGISRLGSGSQVMASYLAMKEGWTEAEQPKFAVKGQFKPLRDAVNSTETSVFLWEWFTTKPYVDSGEVRFIGSVYTVTAFLDALQPFVRRFNSAEAREKADVDFVVDYFKHRREDVVEWLASVTWEEEIRAVGKDTVVDTLRILEKAGVVVARDEWDPAAFVNTDVAKLV